MNCNGPNHELYSAYYTQCNSEFAESCQRENNPYQNSLLISLNLYINVSTNSTGDYTYMSYDVDVDTSRRNVLAKYEDRLAIGK